MGRKKVSEENKIVLVRAYVAKKHVNKFKKKIEAISLKMR